MSKDALIQAKQPEAPARNRCSGLSDEPVGAAGPVDWREWAGKTIAGTVFAQPEPEAVDRAYSHCPGAQRSGLPGRLPSVARQPVRGDL